MIKLTDKHVYLALILAIAAAFSSGSFRDGFYRHVSDILMTNSGMEAGIDAGAIGEDPEKFATR
jgi:hypothetical protein